MNADGQENKAGFFSKIMRGWTASPEAAVEEIATASLQVCPEKGEGSPLQERVESEQSPHVVLRQQVETFHNVAPASSGAVASPVPPAFEPLRTSPEKTRVPDVGEEAELLVITSDGMTGPQVRRTRGHGPTIVPTVSAKAHSLWLLPESLAISDVEIEPEAVANSENGATAETQTLPEPVNVPVAPATDASISTRSVPEPQTLSMANNLKESLNELMQIDGAAAVALVDGNSGMAMGTAGGGPLNLEVAAAGNSEVVRAKLKAMKALGIKENIEDILISLNTQYHLIRPMAKAPEVFIYLVLNRSSANLAMARHKLAQVERELQI